ncbi:NAD(P)/FAD-dependent oxidoreductase [Paenibacillus sp. GCM10027626]|uniref:NAD(P)/FAD-dependent oxidoreductase n=1 Tax=Paenibacillus sp. GCM10027626 TaxID=3273411 RepID=UPI003626D695
MAGLTMEQYDCVIVGGGIAGLQAAIQLGRFRRKTLVIDAGDGRSVLCRKYNNLLGYPDGVSGQELREKGRLQAEKTGVVFVQARAERAERLAEGFQLWMESGQAVQAKRLLLSTGVVDRMPQLPGLLPCLGRSIYVCPDCDGYEVNGKRTIVLGAGDVGAEMALTIAYWTPRTLTYINHEQTEVSKQLLERLQANKIEYFAAPVSRLTEKNSELSEVVMLSGTVYEVEKGFIAFGGNQVRSELGRQLGASLHENNHILADARTKMTNVLHLWAAGDVVAHSEQVSIAMGDGSQAAIWMHRSLSGVPVPVPERAI